MGIPLIITVIQAGSPGKLTPILGNTKLRIRNTPPTSVIGIPARKSFIFFTTVLPPFLFRRLTNKSVYHTMNMLSNTLFAICSKSDVVQIQWIEMADCKLPNTPLKLY